MAPRGNGAASGLFSPYRAPDVPLQYAPPPSSYTPNSTMSYYNSGRYPVSPMSNCTTLDRIQPATMAYPGVIPENITNGSNFSSALQGPLWRTSPTNLNSSPEGKTYQTIAVLSLSDITSLLINV
ncbi:uncharacterized protein CDAR_276211 [Caerostris darwini]|uniref:Uncharacterized protein n=1 Tax=Caerostris darwini TaxID=1538125 RepID=A0AAV4PZI4_9ARAC|nr:uncharacterized protein CDAR_276211 [Caerostris darwini]